MEEQKNRQLSVVIQTKEEVPEYPTVYVGESVMHLPQPDWLLEDFIQERGLTVIYGPPGSGKSLLAQDWAMCLANGWKWFGKTTQSDQIPLYLMGEGQGGIQGRIMAWQQQRGATQVPQVHWIMNPIPFTAPRTHQNQSLSQRQPSQQQLLNYVKDKEVSLVIVDTLSANFGPGNENQQPDMNQFVELTQEMMTMGAAVIVIHHNAKGSAEMRGSTVLKGAADTVIETSPTFDRDGLLLRTVIKCRKQKDGVPFTRWTMEPTQHNVETKKGTSIVLIPGSTQAATSSETQATHDPPPVDLEDVVSVLAKGDQLTATNLAERLELKSTKVLYRLLRQGIEAGILQQEQRRGPYSLTSLGRSYHEQNSDST